MNHLDHNTKDKYRAFVHEFEQSRPSLFQNVKPQLGVNKSYDFSQKENVGSLPRKVYAPHLKDSVKYLMKETDYPPEKVKPHSGFSPNLSHISCFPQNPMTIKDINLSHCNAHHHANCRGCDADPSLKPKQNAKSLNRSYSKVSVNTSVGNVNVSNITNSYARIHQEEKESKGPINARLNDNYIISIVNQDTHSKNSYMQKFQNKKVQSNKAGHIIQQWYRDRSNSPPKKSKQLTPTRKEWVGGRTFKNSKFYGRNDFYPQHNAPNRNHSMSNNQTKQNSYFEYEEAEASNQLTPKKRAQKSPHKRSYENLLKSPLNSHRNSSSSPEARNVGGRTNGTPELSNHIRGKLDHISFPEHAHNWEKDLRGSRLSEKDIFNALIKIQRAWRKALNYRKHQAEYIPQLANKFQTGSFSHFTPELAQNHAKAAEDVMRKMPGNESKIKETNSRADERAGELEMLVEQLTFELRIANKTTSFLKHDNESLKNSIDALEKNMQAKVDERLAVEKLNNSELVNQYVGVVETLLEEKKELSQRTDQLTAQLHKAEEVIRMQNEALVSKQREFSTRSHLEEENSHLANQINIIRKEVGILKDALTQQFEENERWQMQENKYALMEDKLREYENIIEELRNSPPQTEAHFPNSDRGNHNENISIQLMSLSDENEKLKQEITRLRLYSEEDNTRSTKHPSKRYEAGLSPEKESSARVQTLPDQRTKITEPAKSFSTEGAKLTSPLPANSLKHNSTGAKASPPRSEASVSKSPMRRSMSEKPPLDEMPLQSQQRSSLSFSSLSLSKSSEKQPLAPKPFSSEGLKDKKGSNVINIQNLSIADVKVPASDYVQPIDTRDEQHLTENQVSEEINVDPSFGKDGIATNELEHSVQDERDEHDVVTSEENSIHNLKQPNHPEITHVEFAGLSFQQANPTDYVSFGSPDSKEQINTHFQREAEARNLEFQFARAQEAREQEETDSQEQENQENQDMLSEDNNHIVNEQDNESDSFREDEFDQMEAMQQELMSKFGKILSKMDENSLIRNIENSDQKESP